ncbi:MAG: OmpA family protein [Candidatus Methylumidiphilus sp.]
MARKKQQEEPDDHNRWIVSYADFITLLFALFAVMYAMSSLNAEKYAAMSASMMTAFSRLPPSMKTAASTAKISPDEFKILPNPNNLVVGNMEPCEFDELWWAAPPYTNPPCKPATPTTSDPLLIAVKPEPAATMPTPEAIALIEENAKQDMANQDIERIAAEMTRIANEIKLVLGPIIQLGDVTVTQSEQSVSIVINASILFDPGKAKLNAESTRTLSAIARVLAAGNNRVRVEGFTDNMAVNNSLFPSNWELSAHRAATVTHLFADNGIADDLLTAVGRGQNNPAESNDTPQGRARNRRVIVSILPSKDIN